jgi:hypothetical protein
LNAEFGALTEPIPILRIILGPDFAGREKAGKRGMLFVLIRLDSFNQTRIPLNDKIGVRFVD